MTFKAPHLRSSNTDKEEAKAVAHQLQGAAISVHNGGPLRALHAKLTEQRHLTTRSSERRTLDNNLIWCAKVYEIPAGMTDLQFLQKYSHIGIVDAYILHSPRSFDPNSSRSPIPVKHNSGLLVFPNISVLNHFMENSSAEIFPNERIDVVYLPSLDRLRTPVGCNHIGCRSLLCILLQSSYHTPTETSEVVKAIENRSHAAQILCHSRFASPGLATVIHRCPQLRSCIAKEILTTLLSEESPESYITDSMMLFAELHRKNYFSVDPFKVVQSIFAAEITFTGKISRGLLTFMKRLRESFSSVNGQALLDLWRLRSYSDDAREPIIELFKLVKVCADITPQSDPPRRLHVHCMPSSPSPGCIEAQSTESRNAIEECPAKQTSSIVQVINLPLSSKHTCVACNGRAKLRCTECDKHFCVECQKHDAQLHESLARTVYVSKVDPTLSVKELREIFDKFGVVSKVRLCGDPQQRGMYAFIEFTASSAAKKMLYMDKQPFREGKDDTWRCLPARQPIHDHNDDDMIAIGSSAHPCFFGIPKNMQQKQ